MLQTVISTDQVIIDEIKENLHPSHIFEKTRACSQSGNQSYG